MSDKENEVLEVDEVFEEDDVLVPYDIASYPSDLTLSVLKEMWDNGDIVIPEFQRNFVWSIKQSSLLIESFLIGLPVPQIFLYIDDENKSQVIDGQQRIMSVVYYFEGYFGDESIHGKRQVFRLSGLDDASPYSKKIYSDLDEVSQRKLKSAILRAINIRQLKPSGENTSIYHIFERLNTGGTTLKPQEIRNCVFRGELANKLRELNLDSNWRKILGKETLDKYQKDIELILRIFSLSGDWMNYEKPMKEYLNKGMQRNKDADSDKAKEFFKAFPEVCEIIINKLGVKPFHLRGPLNTSALDSIFCTILDNMHGLPGDLLERYQSLKGNEEFQESTYYGTSDVKVLQNRFRLAGQFLVG